VDATNRDGDPMPVPMREYAVVLVGDTIRSDRPNRVVAKATLLFRAPALKREVYPVVGNDRNGVAVQCQDEMHYVNLPDLSMEVQGPAVARPRQHPHGRLFFCFPKMPFNRLNLTEMREFPDCSGITSRARPIRHFSRVFHTA
jgi:hypothetical protein